MKKTVCILVFVLMLCGGCTSIGSIEDETLDLAEVFNKVEKEIEQKEWRIGTLNEEAIDDAMLKTMYNLTSSDVKEYMVKQAIIPAEVGEIAIFHVSEGQIDIVKDAIQKRIDDMKQEVVGFSAQEDVIKNYQLEEVGTYLVFVVGSDAPSVVQYISSF